MNIPLLIAFGSNINPEQNLFLGLTRLHAQIKCHSIATIYRTKALPDPKQPKFLKTKNPDFLNGALLIQEDWDPWELQHTLKTIEIETGRQPGTTHWGPRTLDLDIMLMGECILQSPTLTLPNPEILTRAFVAIPLAQLAPEWLHPIEKISLATIAARFTPFPGELIADLETTARLQAIIR